MNNSVFVFDISENDFSFHRSFNCKILWRMLYWCLKLILFQNLTRSISAYTLLNRLDCS